MLKNLCCVLINPFRYGEEGNVQWYYTLSIAIQVMFAWRFLPKIASFFTIIWGVHFVFTYISALLINFTDSDIVNQIGKWIFYISNTFLLLLGLFKCWWWTVITLVFAYMCYKLSPDSLNYNSKNNMSISSIMLFILFLIVTVLLPTVWWAKVIIIVSFMIFQYLNEYLSENCLCIDCISDECFHFISNWSHNKKYR